SMPELNGLEAVGRIARDHPNTRAIILSMHGDDESVRRALVAGAAGYLLQNSDRRERALALRAVARRDTWLSPSLPQRVVATYMRGASPDAVLTPRQRE